VALAGGSVMAAVAAGRRTSSAFPSFVARYGYDALLESVKPLPSVIALPEVESAMELPAFGNGTLSIGREQVSGGDVTFLGLPELQPWPIVKLVAGRMPLASDPTGVLASVTAEQFGVHLGSIITMPMYSSTQHSALSAPAGSIPPHGPTVHLVVVGIEADAVDFPSGTPFFSVFAGPAFERTFGPRLLLATATLVRLRHGSADVSRFSEQFEHLAAGKGYAENVDALEATVQQTITPQVTGWNLLALLAALAALAVVGQAFGRQSAAQVESYPTLRALGVRPAELFRLGVVSATSIGLLGAVGAVGLAWALSPLTPLGVARRPFYRLRVRSARAGSRSHRRRPALRRPRSPAGMAVLSGPRRWAATGACLGSRLGGLRSLAGRRQRAPERSRRHQARSPARHGRCRSTRRNRTPRLQPGRHRPRRHRRLRCRSLQPDEDPSSLRAG
jgi:hypothetical protein